MARTTTNADGSNLARHLSKDAALRRTLAKLQAAHAGVLASSVVVGGSVSDIAAVAVAAYQQAAAEANRANPACDISWTLVAGIGRVESDHGRYGGSSPGANGKVTPPILGPVLDGSGGNAAIPDTDGGRYDGDKRWDRAVGPMQFIPSTWAIWGRDGNGDGIRDPENIYDAALATADYLCASGGDLSTPAAAERAVLSYNHSLDYVLVVLGYASAYGGQDLSPVSAEIAKYLAALAKAHHTPVNKHPKKPAKKGRKPIVRPAPHPSPTPVKPTLTPVPKPTLTPQPTPTDSPTATPGPADPPSPTPAPSEAPTPTPSDSQSDGLTTTGDPATAP